MGYSLNAIINNLERLHDYIKGVRSSVEELRELEDIEYNKLNEMWGSVGEGDVKTRYFSSYYMNAKARGWDIKTLCDSIESDITNVVNFMKELRKMVIEESERKKIYEFLNDIDKKYRKLLEYFDKFENYEGDFFKEAAKIKTYEDELWELQAGARKIENRMIKGKFLEVIDGFQARKYGVFKRGKAIYDLIYLLFYDVVLNRIILKIEALDIGKEAQISPDYEEIITEWLLGKTQRVRTRIKPEYKKLYSRFKEGDSSFVENQLREIVLEFLNEGLREKNFKTVSRLSDFVEWMKGERDLELPGSRKSESGVKTVQSESRDKSGKKGDAVKKTSSESQVKGKKEKQTGEKSRKGGKSSEKKDEKAASGRKLSESGSKSKKTGNHVKGSGSGKVNESNGKKDGRTTGSSSSGKGKK